MGNAGGDEYLVWEGWAECEGELGFLVSFVKEGAREGALVMRIAVLGSTISRWLSPRRESVGRAG